MASNQTWFLIREDIGSPVFNQVKIVLDDVKKNGLFESCKKCTRYIADSGFIRADYDLYNTKIPPRIVKVGGAAAKRLGICSSRRTSRLC